ncbi:hypothetical protein ACU8KH_04152 [Lachancea thermotolerans]
MSGVGESRSELLSWLNELLKLNYVKIEQCGTGAAYCQIIDSIYRDVPMHRVKFNATAEYEFLTNFKILQSSFTKHRLEKTILVEKLVRCRFQDNLEFLQWLKKFWVQNKDESEYDAESRRKYRAPAPAGGAALSQSAPSLSAGASSVVKRRTGGALRGSAAVPPRTAALGRSSAPLATRKAFNEQLLNTQAQLSQTQQDMEKLQKEAAQYREAMAIMERERDFYFGKLRDIEILSQSTKDLCKEGVYSSDPNELVRFLDKVQQILYATEEGFEVVEEYPSDGNLRDPVINNISTAPDPMEVKHQPAHNLITDEETF